MAFDPLDGSSIVDTNFSVGTIFGVWPGDKLTGITGRQQAAAGMGIYGPRTVFCIALKDAPGCHEFLLQDDGKWLHVKETESIGEAGGGREQYRVGRACWVGPVVARCFYLHSVGMLCQDTGKMALRHVAAPLCPAAAHRTGPQPCPPRAPLPPPTHPPCPPSRRRGQDVLPRQPARHL